MSSARTRLFAILGDPVAHSLSHAMHTAAFRTLGLDAEYVALRCAAADVPLAMRLLARNGGGGNVTVPFKAEAAAAVSRPSELVRALVDRAQNMGIAVAAEWVDDEASARLLTAWGVDYLEGALFGEPETVVQPQSLQQMLKKAGA